MMAIDRAKLFSEFTREPPALPSSIDELKDAIPFALPADYERFLREANGGEGFIGESSLMLWPVENLLRRNNALKVSGNAPGLFLIGSDGGGEAYGWDTRLEPFRYVMIPYILMEWEDAYVIADNFDGFLSALFQIPGGVDIS